LCEKKKLKTKIYFHLANSASNFISKPDKSILKIQKRENQPILGKKASQAIVVSLIIEIPIFCANPICANDPRESFQYVYLVARYLAIICYDF
jgi:hypothetical protein